MSNGSIGPFRVPIVPPIGVRIGTGLTYLAPSVVKPAILEAIELGYRHIQETIPGAPEQHQAIRDAITEAVSRGLINSRDELFISCRLQYNGAAPHTIINDLKAYLESQQLSRIDMFLVQWPVDKGNPNADLIIPVWTAMEECQNLSHTNFIGVSDFSASMLENILNSAEVPPSVNQVEMRVFLKEEELSQFCKDNQISMTVISTIGGTQGHLDFTGFKELEGLEKIAKDKQKTIEQVVHRWTYEQEAALLLESLNKEHLQELHSILQWNLSEDN